MISKSENKVGGSSTLSWQVVSVAILINEGKLLLGLRSFDDSQEIWEFPGGTVEFEEQAQEAMVREVKEELDVEVMDSEIAFCLCIHQKLYSRLIVFFYVYSWKGEIKQKVHKKLQWFSYKQCVENKIPNINPQFFHFILEKVSKKLNNKV